MIPLNTTLVTVFTQTEAEPGEGITFGTRTAAAVRAVISTPTGSEIPGPGGGAERIDALLIADPIPGMAHTDYVSDEEGNTFQVAWVTQRIGFGFEHTAAGLVAKTSRTPGG